MSKQDFTLVGQDICLRLSDCIDELVAQKNFKMPAEARGRLQEAIDAIQDGMELTEAWFEVAEKAS